MNLLRKIIGFPFALLYHFVTAFRNWLYDIDFFTSQAFDLPIINVGNLAIGGTGKTPHIEYFIQLLQDDFSPAVLSRGYKRHTSGYIFASTQSTVKQIGDEPLQFKIKHPNIAIAVSENRVLGVPQLLIDAPQTTTILLDDAYQHRAILPGYNILLTDYENLYVDDLLLPAGNLRESKSGAKRADTIIVTKCPANLSEQDAENIKKKLKPLPHQSIYFSYFHYGQPYHFLQPQQRLSNTDQEVLIATGIAKPNYLLNYVNNTYTKGFLLDFGDHHLFTERDINSIAETFTNLGEVDKVILITEKDAVKFLSLSQTIKEKNLPVFVQPIQVGILFNQGKQLNTEVINFVQNFYKHE